MTRIPTLLIHGSLGSGKTTLVERVLLDNFFRGSFIIENEFASENIDEKTLHEHSDEEVLGISGGCICCSTGRELEDALEVIVAKQWTRPVIIETTGVASSVQLIQRLFLNIVFLEHFLLIKNVLVVDPLETSEEEITTSKRMDILLADIVIIGKTDLAPREEIDALEAKILMVAPRVTILRSAHMDMDTTLFSLGSSLVEDRMINHFTEIKKLGTAEHEISYVIYEPSNKTTKEQVLFALATCKKDVTVDIRRVKGYFEDTTGTWWHVEATSKHHNISTTTPKEKSVLVFIGRNIKEEMLSKIFSGIRKKS